MRDDTKPFQVSRRAPKPVEVTEVTSILKSSAPNFPNNNGTLLPSHFYSQFKEWYHHMSVPFAERSDANKEWIATSQFKFNRPRVNYVHSKNRRGGYGDRRGENRGGNDHHRGTVRSNHHNDSDRRGHRAHRDCSRSHSRSRSRSRSQSSDHSRHSSSRRSHDGRCTSRRVQRSKSRSKSPEKEHDNRASRRRSQFGNNYSK